MSERGTPVAGRHSRLLRRTVFVSVLTFASRILGFVREVISAAIFGDKAGIFDAFITAWRIPNLFRRFLGEGALSTALVTRLTEVDHSEGLEAGRRLFWDTLRLVAGILALLSGAVMLLAHLAPDLAPDALLAGVLGKDHGAVLELTVRLMPFVILICLSAILGGALNVRDHFLAPLLAPVLLNAGWILALVLIGMHFGWVSPFEAVTDSSAAPASPAALPPAELARQLDMTRALAWGVLASGVLQLVCQVPALFRTGFLGGQAAPDETPSTASSRSGAWSVLKVSAPLAFGAAIYQVNVMVDGFMAEALLPDGGPTAHYYANRVQQFPFALIALAATSSVFPRLKVLGHERDLSGLRYLHDRTQLAVAFLALPAAVGLLMLARPITSLLFEHGAYGPDGVARVSAALAMLALALLPAGCVSLVTRAYYAIDDFRTPVVVSSLLLFVNIGLNLALVRWVGMDVEGLALATAITSWLNLAFLLPPLLRRLPRAKLPADEQVSIGRRLVPMVLAALFAGGAAWGAREVVWGLAEGLGRNLGGSLALGAGGLAGVLGYFAAVAALGVPEWRELRSKLAARRGA
ncbi:MAG: murein biosynthesis integral membrane protein MurJ [Planctomycetota bacterium]|nr:murein biosynthesis integral membrane protein MurJ [Planctomycetota bacterium]